MTTETLKPTVTEIADKIQDAYNNSDGTFQDLLRTTSTWDKHKEIIEKQFKELVGSEKQIVWAEKIRAEKATLVLINRVAAIWDLNARKTGKRGFGLNFSDEQVQEGLQSFLKENSFIFSGYASKIIDNRF